MVGVETIMTGIMDTWQSLVLHWQYRVLAVIGVCTIGFVLGIPCTTQVCMLCPVHPSTRGFVLGIPCTTQVCMLCAVHVCLLARTELPSGDVPLSLVRALKRVHTSAKVNLVQIWNPDNG